RHESRRIDNQLRGRSGRQGDPGSSRFFVSFADDLMRRFAPEWLPGMMEKLGMEDEALESKMVTRAIETAQGKVEAYNFDIRKNVVEYDDVMNTHRDVIYAERNRVLNGEEMRDTVQTMVEEELEALAALHLSQDPDLEAFGKAIDAILPISGELMLEQFEEMSVDEASDLLIELAERRYDELEETAGEEMQRTIERYILLTTIDSLWVQHLTAMDEMRQGIGLRAYAQSDPLVAYKREAHDMWGQLLEKIRAMVVRQIFHARPVAVPQLRSRPQRAAAALHESGPSEDAAAGGVGAGGGATTATAPAATAQRAVKKVGRNAACPCGSGKKYKRCHGAAA
ncbi:MAG: SEC-C metal-binding domain-containing protein, partial [Dehalococcoidia bacterium]